MRKHLRALLAICLVLSLVCQIKPSAAAAYDDSFNVSGYTMSEDYFKAAYGSNPADRSALLATKGSETKTATDARISNVLVKDNAISLTVNMGTTAKNISVGGKMYASARTQNGVNCIVVDAKCSNIAYDVLSFEIWNDNDVDHQVLYNTSVKSAPHVKLYLQSSNGEISLYEFPLPVSLNDLDASNYEKADKAIDLLWPLKVVDSTVTEVPTDDAILEELGLNDLSRDANTWTTWVNSRTYFDTFYIGEYTYCSVSLPYVDYRYTNVASQDSTWVASFKVSENLTVSCPYEDNVTYHGENAFDYRSIKLAFGCGDNSTFMRAYQEGRMDDTSNHLNPVLLQFGAELTVYAYKKIVSQYPIGSTFWDIIDIINNIQPVEQEVVLGASNISLANTKAIAVGEKLPHKYRFEACTNQNGEENVGDYFTFQAVIQYENAGGNTRTAGVLAIEFEVNNFGEGYQKTQSHEIQFGYNASA